MSRFKLKKYERLVNEWLTLNGLDPVQLQYTPFAQRTAGMFVYHGKGRGLACSIGITDVTESTVWHEVGHYVDHSTPGLLLAFKKETEMENPVSRYGRTSVSEKFAEAFSRWHCKPESLQASYPVQYSFFASRYEQNQSS